MTFTGTWTTCVARPPREVSLYFSCMSRLVSRRATSASLPELSEAELQVGSIRPVTRIVGNSDPSAVEFLEGREQLAIRVFAQPGLTRESDDLDRLR